MTACRLRLLGLLAASLAAGCSGGPALDLLVRGGTVVDGTGGPRVRADVGIRDGRIVLVGSGDRARPRDIIDASGLVVAPGFIDAHNHSAPAIAQPDRKFNEGFVRQGVTTIVGGPDGGLGPDEIEQLVAAYDAQGIGTNVAFYIGHNAIRRQIVTDGRREATADEIDAMRELVRRGMELGAVGFSTGLMYEPGMFAGPTEVVELAREAAEANGIYDSHVRDPAHDLLGSDREAIEVGERAGLPVKIAHEKAVGLENRGLIKDVIVLIATARSRGLDVVTDQYPYDGAATGTLEDLVVVPTELRDAAGFDLKRALAEPATRARLEEASEQGIAGGFAWLKATGYSHMRVTSSRDYPELVGQYLSAIAEVRGGDPFDVVAGLLAEAHYPVYVTLGAIAEEDVRALLVQPWNMIASDGAYVDPASAGGHPRSAGTFPRVLGHYARDEGLLSLEEAVRKMTSFPARFLGLYDRGEIREGAPADLTIFDPDTIIDRSTWDEPQRFAEGVVHVIVNGVPVLRHSMMTSEAPGRFLRRQR